ncbi:hypothetical protein ELG63_36520 [Rhizobium leguminosarum]|uniref:hypothetical protein n=1 Tax=Rhizobium leguminosarum TaxID=384 RepID=UPI0010300BA6|nr:hypothetical protein [Rhizobium leguminosarum]TBH28195.1 hypothetical protein ELG63_36520 [Rhizobium leguminosarum]
MGKNKRVSRKTYPMTNWWFEMPPFGPEDNVHMWAAIAVCRKSNLTKSNVSLEYLPSMMTTVELASVNANDVLILARDTRVEKGELISVRLDYRVVSISDNEITLESHFSALGAIRKARRVAGASVTTAVIGRNGIRRSAIPISDPAGASVIEAMERAERLLDAQDVPLDQRREAECVIIDNGARVELKRFREGWRLKRYGQNRGRTTISLKVPRFGSTAIDMGEAA